MVRQATSVDSTDELAVLARSVVAAADSVLVTGGGRRATILDGAHVMLPDGRVALALRPPRGCAQAGGAPGDEPVAVHLTSIVPVAVRERVRARVTLCGRLRSSHPSTLAERDALAVLDLLTQRRELWLLTPDDVFVGVDDRLVALTATAWDEAVADPLAADEAAVLQHLADRRTDLVAGLAGRLAPGLRATADRVLAVALDSQGVVLRVEGPDRHADVRLPFDAPALGVAEAWDRLASLAGGSDLRLPAADERGHAVVDGAGELP